MKKVLTITISALVFVLGLGMLFYPTVSNWLHEQTASYAISDYEAQTSTKTDDEYATEFAMARAYNATLTGDVRSFLDAKMKAESEYENPDYWNTFDEVDGIMGVIRIPTVNITLPIYHGTEESALQKGAGHLEGSALPTGDVGNHTVITGHTGLPSAQLFTDLDELVVGDKFYLEILDRVFSYEVTDIFVVLPSETEHLTVQSDKDLVTLVTCTPYGINSHRLLIRGERSEEALPIAQGDIPAVAQEIPQRENSHILDNLPVLLAVAFGFALLFLVAIVIFTIRSYYRPKRLDKGSENMSDNEK